jgi:hypothetical protein
MYLWDVENEIVEMKVSLQASVSMVEWNPFDENEILLLVAGGEIKLLNLA